MLIKRRCCPGVYFRLIPWSVCVYKWYTTVMVSVDCSIRIPRNPCICRWSCHYRDKNSFWSTPLRLCISPVGCVLLSGKQYYLLWVVIWRLMITDTTGWSIMLSSKISAGCVQTQLVGNPIKRLCYWLDRSINSTLFIWVNGNTAVYRKTQYDLLTVIKSKTKPFCLLMKYWPLIIIAWVAEYCRFIMYTLTDN